MDVESESAPFGQCRRRAVVGEADDLVPGLDSTAEEEYQSLVTESYLRLGLVEQREPAPVP